MKRILVLNLVPNTIGDSILLLPFFKILRKNFPDAYILTTADPVTKELWKDNPEISEIIEINELVLIGNPNLNKISKLYTYLIMMLHLTSKLKKLGFSMCFVIYPNFFLIQLIPWLSGIKERIGFSYKGAIFNFLLTKKAKSMLTYDGFYNTHIIESYLNLLRAANIPFSEKDTFCMKTVAQRDLTSVKEKLKSKGITLGKRPVICLHTQSKAIWKNWPIEFYGQLIKLLIGKYDAYIFLAGSKREFEINNTLAKIDKKVYNLCGEYTLSEVGALLKLSDLFIGNDSGLAHYSSSVGTKTLVIFGASSPIQAGPRGSGETVTIFKNQQENTLNFFKRGDIESDLKIMREIKPKEVMEKAERLLKKNS